LFSYLSLLYLQGIIVSEVAGGKKMLRTKTSLLALAKGGLYPVPETVKRNETLYQLEAGHSGCLVKIFLKK